MITVARPGEHRPIHVPPDDALRIDQQFILRAIELKQVTKGDVPRKGDAGPFCSPQDCTFSRARNHVSHGEHRALYNVVRCVRFDEDEGMVTARSTIVDDPRLHGSASVVPVMVSTTFPLSMLANRFGATTRNHSGILPTSVTFAPRTG